MQKRWAVHTRFLIWAVNLYLVNRGGQNDDFRPLTYTLGGRGMGFRDKYETSWGPSCPSDHTDSHTLDTYIWGGRGGSIIRSMSSIWPICKCRCPPLLVNNLVRKKENSPEVEGDEMVFSAFSVVSALSALSTYSEFSTCQWKYWTTASYCRWWKENLHIHGGPWDQQHHLSSDHQGYIKGWGVERHSAQSDIQLVEDNIFTIRVRSNQNNQDDLNDPVNSKTPFGIIPAKSPLCFIFVYNISSHRQRFLYLKENKRNHFCDYVLTSV